MTKIFSKASEEVATKYLTKARAWADEPNQHMFKTGQSSFVSAIAEYLANENGLTIFDCNATYPKAQG